MLEHEVSSEGSAPTRTAEILDTLRADILSARLPPDAKLRFDELKTNYSIGISPLREALMQLASEGLVVAEHRRGYRVAPISAADLREIARLRGEFDSIALRDAIANGDELWEGRIQGSFHAMSKRRKIGPDGEIDVEWERHHVAFHAALTSACELPKLLAFKDILDRQALRYRRMAVHYLTAPRDDLGEHEAIRTAVLERDAETACDLIKRHYMQTVEIILAAPKSSTRRT